MKNIGDVLAEVAAALSARKVPFALGGALALSYYADPRVTKDIDLNIAVPFSGAVGLVDDLGSLGYRPGTPPDTWLPIAGVALVRDSDPYRLDLFFAFDGFHDTVMSNAIRKRFPVGDATIGISVLAPNDLAVFKISFNRPRDWVDIDAMLVAGTPLDADYVERQLVSFRGPTMYPRVARLRQMIAQR